MDSSQQDHNHDDNSSPAAPKKPSRFKQVMKYIIYSVIAIVVLLITLFITLLIAGATQSGTKTIWNISEKITGGRLSGKLVSGTLYRGVDLQEVAWQDKTSKVSIDYISGRWTFSLLPLKWHAKFISLGHIDLTSDSSKEDSKPLTLPKTLRLPLSIDIDQLNIEQIVIHHSPESQTTLSQLRAMIHLNAHQHQLQLAHLETEWGSVNGDLKVQANAPFDVSGSVQLQESLDPSSRKAYQDLSARVDLSGTLSTLQIQLKASSQKMRAAIEANVTPFADVPLSSMDMQIRQLNLNDFSKSAPQGVLNIDAHLKPIHQIKNSSFQVSGPISVVNALPGKLTDHQLPFNKLSAIVTLSTKQQILSNIHLQLIRQGVITGQAILTPEKNSAQLNLSQFDPSLFTSVLRKMPFNGQINWLQDRLKDEQSLDLALNAPMVKIQSQLNFDQDMIDVKSFEMALGDGKINFSGEMGLAGSQAYHAQLSLNRFNPFLMLSSKLLPQQSDQTKINGLLSFKGKLAEHEHRLNFQFKDSMYAGLPLSGQGDLAFINKQLLQSQANLAIAGNLFNMKGAFGAKNDQLNVHLIAKNLSRLGFGLKGNAVIQGVIKGTLQSPIIQANYQINQFSWQQEYIGLAEGQIQFNQQATAPFSFHLNAEQVDIGGFILKRLVANIDGTQRAHQFKLDGIGQLNHNPLAIQLLGKGGLSDQQWQGELMQLKIAGLANIDLLKPVRLSFAPHHIVIGQTSLELEGAQLMLDQLQMGRQGVIFKGNIRHVAVARLMFLKSKLLGQPNSPSSNLILDGDWDFHLSDHSTGFFNIQRKSGDLIMQSGEGFSTIGLNQLNLTGKFLPQNRLQTNLRAEASRIGTLNANLDLPLLKTDQGVGINKNGQLNGKVNANIPSLRTTGGLLGPNYILDGQANLLLNISGSLLKPKASGYLRGDDLAMTIVNQGINIKQGVIHILLSNNLLNFENVEFRAGEGFLKVIGNVQLDGLQPNLSAQIIAKHFELLFTPDRRLSLSGDAKITSVGSDYLEIGGKFLIDRALFDLPEEAAPQLSSDVVIVKPDDQGMLLGRAKKITAQKAAPKFSPRANIALDLGKDFRFKGHGADLGLMGSITVMSEPAVPLKAIGSVRVTQGSTYTAFGRKLNIENGFFTFNGPIANPGINILAMKRNQRVEAGVQVTGAMNSPQIKLISEPNVSDNDKLSWLLFGHGSDQGLNLGQENAMTSALALLGNMAGSRVEQSLGIDEFSIGTSEVGLTDPQVLQVSKALNEYFILGYEQGLETSANAVKLAMNISRFWAIMVYGGTYQGVDLSYHNRFDHWFNRQENKPNARK